MPSHDDMGIETLDRIAALAPIGECESLSVREAMFTGQLMLWGVRKDGTAIGLISVTRLVGEVMKVIAHNGWDLEANPSKCRISVPPFEQEPSRELALVFGFEEPDPLVRILVAFHAAMKEATDSKG